LLPPAAPAARIPFFTASLAPSFFLARLPADPFSFALLLKQQTAIAVDYVSSVPCASPSSPWPPQRPIFHPFFLLYAFHRLGSLIFVFCAVSAPPAVSAVYILPPVRFLGATSCLRGLSLVLGTCTSRLLLALLLALACTFTCTRTRVWLCCVIGCARFSFSKRKEWLKRE
jgi:hypothetical protein